MSEVRVRPGPCRGQALRFEGEQPFFERWVEPLMQHTTYRRRPRSSPRSTRRPRSGRRRRPLSLRRPREPTSRPRARSRRRRLRPAVSEPEPAGDTFQPASPLHFNQFVAQVGDRASTPEQRVMAFGFYLWNYEKRETFTTRDVAGLLPHRARRAARRSSADLLDDLVIRKRFLEEDDRGTTPGGSPRRA